jgi:hypothetical protein
MRGLSAELSSLLLRIVSEGMRRWSTVLVVAAVAAVAVFAAADALRGNGEPTVPAASPTGTRPQPPTLRETLRGQGISGQILYSDQDCILHSLVLPQMVDDVVRGENGAGAFHSCRFSVAAGRFRDDDELVSPDGQLVARCRAGHVEVFIESSGRRLSRVAGCAPAWRPDSGLTYARNGEILLGGGVVLLSRPKLRAAARRHPNLSTYEAGFDVRVTDLAWLDETRLVVAMEISSRYIEPQFLAVVFRGKTITAIAASFRGPYRNLVVSPGGSFVASGDGTLFTRDGRAFDPPQNLSTGAAEAFSPDERWLAYATGASIYLIGTPRNSEPGRIIRLPVPAQDLVWEGVSRATPVAGLGTG